MFYCFHSYVDLQDVLDESVCLPSLLHFITGESVIPPMGLKHPIEVQYHPPISTAIYMGAQACYSIVYLPVVHETREDFFSASISALQLEGHSYGNA